LPKPPDVLKAATGPDGILEGLVNGGIWIDHSTTDYEQNLMFEEIASKKDAHILECPITGGPSMPFYSKLYPVFRNILSKFSKALIHHYSNSGVGLALEPTWAGPYRNLGNQKREQKNDETTPENKILTHPQ
jgi:hypothetical protein